MTSQLPDPALVSVFRGPLHYRERAAVGELIDQSLAALNLPDGFISPGDRVVIKPNWVKEHDERRPGPNQWEHMVTHPAVIEAVIRWAAARLRGRGSVTVCDAPQTDSSFARLREYCGFEETITRCREAFPGVTIDVLDLRPEEWLAVDGVTVSKTALPGLLTLHPPIRDIRAFRGSSQIRCVKSILGQLSY